ncbi:MAG: hydrolase TatD [Marinilabiliales bacterium]|nr:MAG: hydrolase TatD [Marinilabiliales bacterium]
MIFADTHTHLYLNAFDDDRESVVKNAIDAGVDIMILPNIDSGSIEPLLELTDKFPEHCFPMMGLHPTSVKENYKAELKAVEDALDQREYVAIGEIGIDLYWDKTYFNEQVEAFKFQLEIALDLDLPVAIHTRDSMEETLEILALPEYRDVRGVLHCFSGDASQAKRAVDLGYYLGIGGVLTFKNSGLRGAIKDVPLSSIILETDAPFLAPVPYRGGRNESAYIPIIATHLSDLFGISREEVAMTTTNNALTLFKTIKR